LEGFAPYVGDAHHTVTSSTNCYKLSAGRKLMAHLLA
jgi:hypothetical protein